jgi:predicted enzyme related to lactoylglutathione lyase
MRIVHFEIPADDPARAMAFYQSAFGWSFDKWEGPTEDSMVTTDPNGNAFGVMQFDSAAA